MVLSSSCRCGAGVKTIRQSCNSSRVRNPAPPGCVSCLIFIRAKRVSNCYMREKKTDSLCVYVRQIAKTRYTFACLHTHQVVFENNQPNIYIHTTNRQQNTQTQYPPHGERPGINRTQATTIVVKNTTDVLNFTPPVNIKTILFSNIVLNIIPTLMRVI